MEQAPIGLSTDRWSKLAHQYTRKYSAALRIWVIVRGQIPDELKEEAEWASYVCTSPTQTP